MYAHMVHITPHADAKYIAQKGCERSQGRLNTWDGAEAREHCVAAIVTNGDFGCGTIVIWMMRGKNGCPYPRADD